MKKFTLMLAIACMALTNQVMSQCTPAAVYTPSAWAEAAAPTTPYTGYLCQGHDSIFTRAGWDYYDGDGYFFKLIAGSDVTITVDNCTGNDCELTVVDSTAGAGVGSFIAGAYATAACPNSLTFTAPYTGKYTIVFNTDADCSTAGATAVGISSIKLNNAGTITNCTPILGPVNDSICGATPLTLNNLISGNNSSAAGTDVDDATLTTLGYACFTLNNTLWYSYTPTTTDTVEVQFITDPANSPLSGWFAVVSSTSPTSPCNTSLNYEGCYYGPLNATASGSGATADPYDGVIPTTEVVLNHILLTAGVNYFFAIDGVAGGVGSYQFGIFPVITGIDNIETNSNLVSVYPSPASQNVTISLNPSLGKSKIEIYNSIGGLVKTINDVTGSTNVEVAEFAKGVYTIKVFASDKVLSQRFSVVK